MEIKPIETATDHRAASKEIEALMTAQANSPEGERLDVLVTLVEACERRHYSIDAPTPLESDGITSGERIVALSGGGRG